MKSFQIISLSDNTEKYKMFGEKYEHLFFTEMKIYKRDNKNADSFCTFVCTNKNNFLLSIYI